MNNKIQKIDSLQALRAIAFMGIFLLHSGCFVEWGTLAVAIFFVLSGFLLVNSYYARAPQATVKESIVFSFNKIKKLYPLHIITMLLSAVRPFVLLLQSHDTNGLISLLKTVLYNVFLIQTFIPVVSINVSLNGVAWYLSVSMVLYFLFPFLLKVIMKIDDKCKLFILCLLLYIAMYFIGVFSINVYGLDGRFFTWLTYCCPLYRVGDFFIGMVLGYFFHENSLRGTKNVWINSFIEVVSFVAIFAFYKASKNTYNNIYLRAVFENWTWLLIVFAVVLITIFINPRGIFSNLLSNELLVRLGNISPYLFLIHYVVIQYAKLFIAHYQIQLNLFRAWCLIGIELVISIIIALIYSKIAKKLTNIKRV